MVNTKIQPPCHGCEERHRGCHASCEKYKAYHEESVERSRQIYDAKKKESEATQFMIESMSRRPGKRHPIEHLGGRKGR